MAPTGLFSPAFPRVNTPFSPLAILDLLMRVRALCIQKALEKSVIRVGRHEGRSLGHDCVN
jgi:hypothetical protein